MTSRWPISAADRGKPWTLSCALGPAGAVRGARRLLPALIAFLMIPAVIPSRALAHGGGLPSVIPRDDADNYRSEVRGLNPPIQGLTVEVLDRDDRLRLVNTTGKTVVVEGDLGEPMFRLLASGKVEVNRRSPTAYLSEERFGRVRVPLTAASTAEPRWTGISFIGELSWHDHRIHWMLPERPRRVGDEDRRTKGLRMGGAGLRRWPARPGGRFSLLRSRLGRGR